MTNEDILRIAMEQSAIDLNCRVEDFSADEPIMVLSRPHPDARVYLKYPIECNLVSYGNNVVASVLPEFWDIVDGYVRNYPTANLMETPHLHMLEQAFLPYGLSICFMAEYFLPDIKQLKPLACPYELRLLGPKDFSDLYLPEWSNALCVKRKERDVIAMGAYDHGRLIGLAGASADCDTMWQIGIDVLPEYRRQGIASALTSRLAIEILNRGKVPFYCAAWCNVKSVRNAIKSGFRPAWVEMTAKSCETVDGMNK